MLNYGYSYSQLIYKYRELLTVDNRIKKCDRALLVDDVCTHGGTLGVSCEALCEVNLQLDIVAATACQMIVVSALKDESILLAD